MTLPHVNYFLPFPIFIPSLSSNPNIHQVHGESQFIAFIKLEDNFMI